MKNIDYYINSVLDQLNSWHNSNFKIFELDNELDDLENLVIRLSYHNYIAWHMIEEYKNSDTDVVQFVYNGGLLHNAKRNHCMQKIDEIYVNIQKSCDNFNSEGMGSIFDKLTNDHIKYLHLVENKDDRQSLLLSQVNFHKKCLNKVHDEILKGNLNIIIFQKFKINGY